MKTVRVVNRTRGTDLARAARVADTRWTRLRGLLGRPRLRPGEGLILTPSRGVHTWGMRYTIDVVLVGDEGRVAAVYSELDPWSRTRLHTDAARALEFPAGTIESTGTRAGDQVQIVWSENGGDPEAENHVSDLRYLG